MYQTIKKAFFIPFVFIVLSTACTAGENMNANGKFVFTDGSSTINAIDFSSSEFSTSTIFKSKEVGAINHLIRVDSNTILFGECPISRECVLRQYSIDVGKSEVLRTGRLPSYLPNHKRLFFYDKASDGSNWLYETALDNITEVKKVAKEPSKKVLPNGVKQSVSVPVVQVSNNEIIYVGDDKQLWLYNIIDKKRESTEIKNCRPILWREKHNQLLCSDWETWTPFLLDLNTKRKVKISELKEAYGFAYIKESDTLIYGKTRLKAMVDETYDIFLYSFQNKEEKRIKKNTHLASGVWFK